MKNAARFLTLLLVMTIALAAPADAAVIMRGKADVKGGVVRLSDVFDGLPGGADHDIARAPAPGKSIIYNVNVLVNLARQYALEWQPQSLADQLVVTRASIRITTEDIRRDVVEKIRATGAGGAVDVAFDNRALEIDLPADRPANFMLNNFEYDSTNRRFRADLAADGGEGQISLPVTGRVILRREVPVLAKRLEAGTVIAAADLEWRTVEDDRSADVVTSAAPLIGRELRNAVDEGVPLRARDVRPPRLVTRGSLVTLKIQTPFMLVTAQGKSLQDGTLGDTVRVTNTQSNRMVEGVVESDGSVRIPIAQHLAAATDAIREE